MSLILAGALISIALNPLIFSAIKPFKKWLLSVSTLASSLEKRIDPYAELPMTTERKFLQGQVVLVGYGRVGKRIAEALSLNDIPFVVAEENREIVNSLRKSGLPAVSGDASEPSVLIQAHIANASMLVIATPDTIDIRKMVDTARLLQPNIQIVVRTHSETEARFIKDEDLGTVFFGEEELAKGMTKHVLARYAPKANA